MSALTSIVIKAMLPAIEKHADMVCNEYETNPKYRILKIEDGFCVCHDDGDIRWLDEAHYLGNNKFMSVKMWKFMTKGAKILRLPVQKLNTKMVEFYKRIGFKIIQENEINYIMER